MSKRNTRLRVTRIAAAAVIAAGASLTAVGAAQAVTTDTATVQGSTEGDTVSFQAPRGERRYVVVAIR